MANVINSGKMKLIREKGAFPAFNTLVVKMKYNYQSKKLVPTEDCVFFQQESLRVLKEYAPDSFLCAGMKTQDIFQVENLSEHHTIKAPDSHNDQKNAIEMIAEFHPDKFPFFFVSGAMEIWIGSLKTK